MPKVHFSSPEKDEDYWIVYRQVIATRPSVAVNVVLSMLMGREDCGHDLARWQLDAMKAGVLECIEVNSLKSNPSEIIAAAEELLKLLNGDRSVDPSTIDSVYEYFGIKIGSTGAGMKG